LLAGILWTGLATGQQPKAGPPGAKADVKSGKADARQAAPAQQIKTFDLTRADPEEVRQILAGNWTSLMGLRGQAGGSAPRFSVDRRTGTLFVSGTEKELELVQDFVRIMDAGPDETPEVNGLQVIRLRHAKVAEVTQILAELGLQGRVLPLTRTNTLILAKEGAGAQDVRSVVEKVDVEKKPNGKVADKSGTKK
jgi:type II secretory pathway component GspD/PulD (secretin)